MFVSYIWRFSLLPESDTMGGWVLRVLTSVALSAKQALPTLNKTLVATR